MIQILVNCFELICDIVKIKKGKLKTFPFCPGNKVVHKDKYFDYMKNINPKIIQKPKD